jgi:hypothetical protein
MGSEIAKESNVLPTSTNDFEFALFNTDDDDITKGTLHFHTSVVSRAII